MDDVDVPSRCSLCGRPHGPLPGRCSAGLETCPCSESGRWRCREPGGEWQKCEHWAIDAVMEQRRARVARRSDCGCPVDDFREEPPTGQRTFKIRVIEPPANA